MEPWCIRQQQSVCTCAMYGCVAAFSSRETHHEALWRSLQAWSTVRCVLLTFCASCAASKSFENSRLNTSHHVNVKQIYPLKQTIGASVFHPGINCLPMSCFKHTKRPIHDDEQCTPLWPSHTNPTYPGAKSCSVVQIVVSKVTTVPLHQPSATRMRLLDSSCSSLDYFHA